MSRVIGRFAPSPTGPLHRGSLLAALGSFLQARSQGGDWRIRIDDLDPDRVQAGCATGILETLRAFGLRWDEPILWQSERGDAYAEAIARLRASGDVFDCGCTRREAQTGPQGLEGPIYPGTCRDGLPAGRDPRSVRARVRPMHIAVADYFQGRYGQQLERDIGDFIVRRADSITAYQLATVVDDGFQGVTEVVRGADLLSSTPRQIYLQRCLGLTTPRYGHLPLLVDAQGEKLGKSRGALALSDRQIPRQLYECLDLLGQRPPADLAEADVARILGWAVDNWSPADVPAVAALPLAADYQRSESQRSGLAQ